MRNRMKPETWNQERAESFRDADTVSAYRFRAPYPAEAFQILADLIADEPRVVLDVGCGTGEIARNLADLVDRIDAVDFSLPMIEAGKKKPNGNHPNLNWMHGKVEEVSLNPPYSLITAGMSMHWLDWGVVFSIFSQILTPNGNLAIVYNAFEKSPWHEEVRKLRHKYRGYRGKRPLSVVEELEKARMFKRCGIKETSPIIHTQTVDAYIEQFHSRSDMARMQIGKEAATDFDAELRKILSRYIQGNTIETRLHAYVTWGRPLC